MARLLLSQALRSQVVPAGGQSARLLDLGVAIRPDESYPRISHLYCRGGRVLELGRVRAVGSGRIEVDEMETAEGSVAEAPGVLLERDVLDALVLDLAGRRVTRANDLCLELADGELRLVGADMSYRGILRRVTRGLVGAGHPSDFSDWKYVEFLRGRPEAVASGAGYHGRITRLKPGEISALSQDLPYLQAAELLLLLPDELAAPTLQLMPLDRQLQLFEELPAEQGTRLLDLMAPDVACDLIGRLGEERAREHLERMAAEPRRRILQLLRYAEDSVGGLMTNDVLALTPEQTVADVRAELRQRIPHFSFLVQVVEDRQERKLKGMVCLDRVLAADDSERLEKILDPYVVALRPSTPGKEGALRLLDTHLAGLPVTDEEGRLLGVLPEDVALAQVLPESHGSQLPRVFA